MLRSLADLSPAFRELLEVYCETPVSVPCQEVSVFVTRNIFHCLILLVYVLDQTEEVVVGYAPAHMCIQDLVHSYGTDDRRDQVRGEEYERSYCEENDKVYIHDPFVFVAVRTGIEPVISAVTGRHPSQLDQRTGYRGRFFS